MKIAQRCWLCKECFITKTKVDTCPFCGEPIPPKIVVKPKTIEPKEAKLLADIFTEQPSTDIIKEFVDVTNEVRTLYNLVYGFLSKNNELIKGKGLNSSELCDFGFMSRELENVFDELRKEVKARKELCCQIIAYRLVQKSIEDPSIKMQVKGQFATGTPDVTMQAALPKKFTPEYYQITDYLGVPRQVAETGVLRLDWKRVTELLTQYMHDGKTIPEGFGKKYPSYKTTYRRRKIK